MNHQPTPQLLPLPLLRFLSLPTACPHPTLSPFDKLRERKRASRKAPLLPTWEKGSGDEGKAGGIKVFKMLATNRQSPSPRIHLWIATGLLWATLTPWHTPKPLPPHLLHPHPHPPHPPHPLHPLHAPHPPHPPPPLPLHHSNASPTGATPCPPWPPSRNAPLTCYCKLPKPTIAKRQNSN